MYSQVTINDTALPSPTKITPSDEILWSSSTGRSVKTGEMLGSVVSKKITLEIEWTNITQAQFNKIKSLLPSGFFGPVKHTDTSGNVFQKMDKAYRGNITSEVLGYRGGTLYYSSVKVSIIEK